jgi:hypothetical protein
MNECTACAECARKDKTIAGLREAIARWKARAMGREARDPEVVRESYDARGVHRVVRETNYPATMPAREVWDAVTAEYGATRVERIETRKGLWLVHLLVW